MDLPKLSSDTVAARMAMRCFLSESRGIGGCRARGSTPRRRALSDGAGAR